MGERETLQELVNDFEQRQKEAETTAEMCSNIDDNDGFVENIDAIKLSYDLVRLRGEWLSRQERFSLHEVDALDAADAILYEMGR